MKETKFTAEELSELESLEIRGGIVADSGNTQTQCVNNSNGCGSGVTQDSCSNGALDCGGSASQSGCVNGTNACGSQSSCQKPPSPPGGNSDPSCYAPPPSAGTTCP